MGKYFIYEGNLEKLDQKMQTIENKCKKYNVAFTYEKTGVEELRIVSDEYGNKIQARFVEIEADGFMKHQDWEFIAKVDHTKDGNIIRQFNIDAEIPTKYRYTDCTCEHCNTRRNRKFTYLIHNTSNDDWKQVGASCLKEYTQGLDADFVAKFISWFDYLIKGESDCYRGVSYQPEYDTVTYLAYVKACIDTFGYLSNSAANDNRYYGEGPDYSTSSRALDYMYVGYLSRSGYTSARNEMDKYQLSDDEIRSSENLEYVNKALEWIRTQEIDENNNYMFNLKLACGTETFPVRNAGFVASLLPTYYRHLQNLEYQAKLAAQKELESASEFQGQIKERITFTAVSCKNVYTYETDFGISHIYKFTDEKGNVYTWSTGKYIDCDDDDSKTYTITGTVKDHNTYRDVKQTVLTRCKVS